MSEEFERIADESDLASKLEAAAADAALAGVRRNMAPQQHPDFDGENCVESDCGQPMPQLRLSMGRIRCTECQERLDRLSQKGRR